MSVRASCVAMANKSTPQLQILGVQVVQFPLQLFTAAQYGLKRPSNIDLQQTDW